MTTIIAIDYINDDGTRQSFTCAPDSRAHREAREHQCAGVCVVIEPIDLDDEGIPY